MRHHGCRSVRERAHHHPLTPTRCQLSRLAEACGFVPGFALGREPDRFSASLLHCQSHDPRTRVPRAAGQTVRWFSAHGEPARGEPAIGLLPLGSHALLTHGLNTATKRDRSVPARALPSPSTTRGEHTHPPPPPHRRAEGGGLGVGGVGGGGGGGVGGGGGGGVGGGGGGGEGFPSFPGGRWGWLLPGGAGGRGV